MKSEILVIIVTFNGMRWIDRCIDSVRKSDTQADILVIDNGSTDGTVERLQKKSVEVICNTSNMGFGAANNIGLRRVLEEGYGYAYLLNQDAWVEPDTFRLLLDAFKDDSYGVLSPVQYDGGGKKMDRQFARRCKRYIAKNKDAGVVEVPFVMAAHWMISRSCILQVGGFSHAFVMYGEDDNYLDRVRWFGLKAGVVPAARAIHDRADRPDSPERRMFLKCNASIIHVSNPAKGVFFRILWEPLRLAGIGCLHFSGTPFRFIGTFLKRCPTLLRYRRKSRKKGAFLFPDKRKRI